MQKVCCMISMLFPVSLLTGVFPLLKSAPVSEAGKVANPLVPLVEVLCVHAVELSHAL